jgi:hypothetical protein
LKSQSAHCRRGFTALCIIFVTYTGVAGFDISATFTAFDQNEDIYISLSTTSKSLGFVSE